MSEIDTNQLAQLAADIQILHGNATEEEIAVIVSVVAAANRIKTLNEPSKLTKWGDPAAHARNRLAVGNQAWRQSAWAKH